MLKTSVIAENLEDLHSFANTLRLIKSAGFDAVDAALFTPGLISIMEGPHAMAYAAEVRSVVEDSGLEIAQCHTVLPYNPKDWNRVIEVDCFTLPFAAAIGAQYPVIHPICPLTWQDPLITADMKTIRNLNVAMYHKILPIAENFGLTVLTENLFADGPNGEAISCYSSHADELNELMDLFLNLKICLDTGHTLITDNSPAAMALSFGERVAALHVHGNNRVSDLHLPPFELGGSQWNEFCHALKQIHYRGTINMEVLSFVRNAPEKLRPVMYEYLHASAVYMAEMVEAE